MTSKAPQSPVPRKVEFPFLYSPDGKMVHIVARMSDDPGALASILTDLRTRVNLIGTSSYSLGEGSAIFSGFGKILSSSQGAISIQAHLSKSPMVRSCQVSESEQGLLVDKFHYGFQTPNGEAYMMVPAISLSSTFEAFVETFKDGGETILFYQGRDYALARMEVYKRIVGSDPKTMFNNLGNILKALGWAAAEIKFDSSGNALRCVNTECFECSAKTKNGRKCAFLRGMAVGTAEVVFGRQFASDEPRCKQRGDPVCEFVITPKDGRPLV